ncbi:MAG: 4-(cytidine 5'-diphospho)-2-C-methyl-D-erythritol kinase, partial [Planctomycetota bacterium]
QKPEIEVISTGPHWAPQGKENIIYKACESIFKQAGIKTGIKITLTKNIPAGSGLGSASSDAAAALLGIKKFLNIELSHEKLHQIASSLGSDVPFFLYGPLALCTGKGEKIKKIGVFFDFTALLVLPDASVSTKRVYENYTHDQDVYDILNSKINALLNKNRFDLIIKMCANMLTESCFRLHEDLADLKSKLESLSIVPVCLSGSGSTMYKVVDSEEKAKAYKFRIKEVLGCNTVIVSNNRW